MSSLSKKIVASCYAGCTINGELLIYDKNGTVRLAADLYAENQREGQYMPG
ncbi:hypothetical protein HOC37_04295 [bacterium]|jgi:hypothetical protein|nr:hypothetical protein [bacterium]MBT3582082.1 hypothetical protein [bacterium]MBT4552184.1 hypothetical protein [bacterium]MBT5989198.1 hypothetical protein [bacterium]MBT7088083.1 hypothetical protein [bacterium]